MDLDIDHYSLQELLKLFKLNENFTSAEFKDARRIVLALHPDKCNQDIKYYLLLVTPRKIILKFYLLIKYMMLLKII